MSAGRVLDLGLHLLDRQVIDSEGMPAGNVDDVEISEDGFVTAIHIGPQALARRLGGLLGEWLAFWSHALSRSSGDEPARVGVELVTDYGTTVRIARTRRELGIHLNEERVREHLIERIPGAHRAGK